MGKKWTLLIAVASLGGTAPASAATCDRACLKGHVDQFIDAVLAHDSSRLPLAASYKATFNGEPTPLNGDLWQKTTAVPYRQYVADPSAGQVALIGVAQQGGQRGSFFLRLRVVDGKITEIESTLGDLSPRGVPGLISPNPLYELPLLPSQKSSRAQLIAIANSYFEGLERHDGSKIPVSPDCRRFEEGFQTSLNVFIGAGICNEGMDTKILYMDRTKERRFPIVDVERGVVLGQMVITVSKPPERELPPGVTPPAGAGRPLMNQPHETLGSVAFKIVDGRIVEMNGIRRDMPYGASAGW